MITGILALSILSSACKKNNPQAYHFVDDPNRSTQPYTAPQTRQIKAFIHSDSTRVFQGPGENQPVKTTLNAFEEVRISGNPDAGMVQLLSPTTGFVNRDQLYDEAQMDLFAKREIAWHTELDLVCHDQTPLADIQASPDSKPAYSLERPWTDDGRHRVRYVRAGSVDLYSKASNRADVLGTLTTNQRMIIDASYKPRSEWVKVVYPFAGYANVNSLYSNEHVCARLERQTILVNKIRAALGLEPLIVEATSKEITSTAESTAPTNVTATPKTRNRAAGTSKTTKPSSGGTKIISWDEHQAQKTDQPLVIPDNDVSNNEALVIPGLTRDPNPTSETKIVTDTRIADLEKQVASLQNELNTLKTQKKDLPTDPEQATDRAVVIPGLTRDPDMIRDQDLIRDSANTNKITIVSPKLIPTQLDPGDWKAEAELDKDLFAGIDSVIMLTYPADNKWRISGLATLAPYHIPVEKNFIKLGLPYGGGVEVGKQNWPVSMGVGYNAMRAQTQSQVYILNARDVSLYAKYTPFKLLQDQLELFVNAGVTGYDVDITNQKYPEHQDYYTPEMVRGIGYMGGAGAMYEFKKFLLGLQYQHYGTPLLVMGPDLNEPETQEELNNFIPTTQYKLFAGAHQFQIIVGYRIN